MSEASDLIHHYNEIRLRLLHPPHPILDTGINLHPRQPESTRKLKVLDNRLRARVTIEEIRSKALETVIPRKVALAAVLRAVADYYGIPTPILIGKKRDQKTCNARHVFVYLALTHTKKSSSTSVGYLLGRDHTTILASKWKTDEIILVDTELAEDIRSLENSLFAGEYD